MIPKIKTTNENNSTFEDSDLAHLIAMGHSLTASRNALMKYNGDIAEAANYLITNSER